MEIKLADPQVRDYLDRLSRKIRDALANFERRTTDLGYIVDMIGWRSPERDDTLWEAVEALEERERSRE